MYDNNRTVSSRIGTELPDPRQTGGAESCSQVPIGRTSSLPSCDPAYIAVVARLRGSLTQHHSENASERRGTGGIAVNSDLVVVGARWTFFFFVFFRRQARLLNGLVARGAGDAALSPQGKNFEGGSAVVGRLVRKKIKPQRRGQHAPQPELRDAAVSSLGRRSHL